MQISNKKIGYLIGSYFLLVFVLISTELSKLYWSISTNIYSIFQGIVPLILSIGIIYITNQKILVEINKLIVIIELFLLFIIIILLIPHLHSDSLIIEIFILLLGASFEELYFRGYLFTQLFFIFKNNHKQNFILISILTSSIIFGSTHIVNALSQSLFVTFIQILTSSILGVILSVSYIRSRTIIIPITIHFLFDISTLSSLSVSTNNFNTTGVTQILIYSIVAYLLVHSINKNHSDSFLNSLL